MRAFIAKIRDSIRSMNKEYILLFLVMLITGFLLHSSIGLTQAPPQQITMTTFYPSPFGEFDRVLARRVLDFDDTTTFIDPSGESNIRALVVRDGIQTRAITGIGSGFTINFNSGGAVLGNLYANYIHMNNAGPPDQRSGGKYVYDIAEGISARDCQAGDVVVINSAEGEDVVKSTRRFDPTVAGVISEDPKLYMGQGEGKLPLALAGIVKCKASAENGKIKRGDLLVSASLPGHAMRAEAKEVKPGMLIGKALQALEQEKGMIFILVNKQ